MPTNDKPATPAVADLPKQWRDRARTAVNSGGSPQVWDGLWRCADELEAALSAEAANYTEMAALRRAIERKGWKLTLWYGYPEAGLPEGEWGARLSPPSVGKEPWLGHAPTLEEALYRAAVAATKEG